MIRLTLPMPPSSNSLFKNAGKARARTAKYDAWRNAAAWDIKSQCVQTAQGEVSVSIAIVAQTKHKFDLDNRIKPILDALVTAGVIPDDNNSVVRKVSIEQVPDGAPVTVLIHELEGSAS